MTPILGIIGSQASTASFESIASTTLGSAGTVTFSSIPQTFRHLHLRFFCKPSTGADYVTLQFNGVAGSNYQWRRIVGAGSTPSGALTLATDRVYVGYADKTTSIWSVGYADIFDYTQTNKFKMVRAQGGFIDNSANPFGGIFDGSYRQTTAITSLTVSMAAGASFEAGSVVALYGIKD